MERQGSGLSKIVESYKLEENYKEDKVPTFYSDRTQFRVIMPNLNYGNTRDDTNHDTNDTNFDTNQKVGLSKKEQKVLNILEKDEKITQKKISIQTGISIASIKRITQKLQNNNYIKRVGGTRGYWKVLKEKE